MPPAIVKRRQGQDTRKMVHEHAPDFHAPDRRADRRRLVIALAIALVFMIAEGAGGLITGSLALLADAGHMLSDAAALGLSLFAFWIAGQPPTRQRTYGYYRAEILAALVNGATLVAVAIYICVEAFQRLREPPVVLGGLMFWIASGGLAANMIMAWVLHTGSRENLNMRGAFLHVLTDMLGSLGAILAAVLIYLFDWRWADPVCSVVIAVLVVISAWRLLSESVSVLMESAPRGLDVEQVYQTMLSLRGVRAVHDLHVWSITSGMPALSAHVTADRSSNDYDVLSALRGTLRERFGIRHITIQFEPAGFERHCPTI